MTVSPIAATMPGSIRRATGTPRGVRVADDVLRPSTWTDELELLQSGERPFRVRRHQHESMSPPLVAGQEKNRSAGSAFWSSWNQRSGLSLVEAKRMFNASAFSFRA
jgi:hypothetical protein